MSVAVGPSPGIREAAQHLHELGHRRTAVVGGSEGAADADRRVRAWCEAVSDLGMDEPVVLRRPYTREGGLPGGQEILALGAPPTAILAASDVQGLGVLAAASRRGLRVPEDLSVVSIDGTLLAAYAQPPFTSVDQPLDLMAREAVGLVLGAAASSDDGGAHGRSLSRRRSPSVRQLREGYSGGGFEDVRREGRGGGLLGRVLLVRRAAARASECVSRVWCAGSLRAVGCGGRP